MTSFFTERDGVFRITVRVVPRSGRSEIDGLYGNALKVRLKAAPVDGAANEELVRVLADELGVSHRNVELIAGARSRTKTVSVTGVGVENVTRLTERASRS